MEQTRKNDKLANELSVLAKEVEEALKKYAIVSHPQYGKVYALGVNGFASYNLMDDANVPGIISRPNLDSVKNTDPVYIATRKMLLSFMNHFFYKGKVSEGVGGPHGCKDMIWPPGITIQGLTSNNDATIKKCTSMLKTTHADKGFMQESFHKDVSKKFTCALLAWANTLFGKFLWKIYNENPGLLNVLRTIKMNTF